MRSPIARMGYLLLALGLLQIGLSTGSVLADASTEYKVKAAFLYHFVQFTEWPEQAFIDSDDPVRVCVYGHDPFDHTLEKVFKGKFAKHRPLVVHRDVRIAALKSCHIAYIGSSKVLRTTTMMRTLQDSYALTVGESKQFIENGGMIQFYEDEKKVRFAINPDALKENNIHVSSKLLRLAKIVRLE